MGRTAIVVAGMHRSGTSAATRIVNLLGADLVGRLIPAGVGNERGHWESSAVQALHNELLAHLGSRLYSPANIPPDWFESAMARPWVARIQDLLASEYAHADFFVLKDPRIALFLPLWTEALRRAAIAPRFLLPFRQPAAVAASLQAREQRLGSGNALPQAQGFAVWLRYVLAAERFTRGQVRAFVAFDALLGDWRTEFARIGRQLDLDWPCWARAQAEIDAFLGGAGHHAGSTEDAGNEPRAGIQAWCRDVHADLESAVPAPTAILPACDAAARALATAEGLLGPHIVAREAVFDDLLRRLDAASRERDAERAQLHARFAAEIGARQAQAAEAAAYAQSLHRRLEALQAEHADARAYAQSLEHDRDRALDYARSLQRKGEEAAEAAAPPPAQQDLVFFTIASRNYLAYAITLMQSVAAQHPDAPRYLVLADRDEDDPALRDAPFATLRAEALDLPDAEAFAFRYDILEFNTAIKPYAFAELRRRHPGRGIVYLDPDILVLEPLTEVRTALTGGALAVLTPHLLEPVDDGLHPGEREILASGTYNCGFVAIGDHADADRLIGWWAQRLEFGALSDVAAGLFTDQKWMDLVPGLFPDVHILRDEGYNLAYWNVSQRPVSRRGSRWYAAERPLAFVHFSGVDVARPGLFSKHQNRHTPATVGALRLLHAHYLDLLRANGHAAHGGKPYAFGRFADGEPICAAVRAVYRRYFDTGKAQAQVHPFAMDRSLYDLPCEELEDRADAPVTRVMYAVWAMRTDLQRAFDLRTNDGRDGFLRWFASTATAEMGVPERHVAPALRALANAAEVGAAVAQRAARRAQPTPLRRAGALSLNLLNWSCRYDVALRFYALFPEAARNRVRRRLERVATAVAAAPAPAHEPGINLVGYAHGEFGVGEILRRHARTLRDGGTPFVVRNFDVGVASRQDDRSMQDFLAEDCRYDVNLFCINADQMPVARRHLGDRVFAGRYNIGCWFWELEKFPERWHGATDLVDEIWVTSPFVRDAIAACTSKPVHIVPVALGVELPRRYARSEVGLPEDDFVCLFSFDFNSFATRKNAAGAIAAFRRAFGDGRRGVRLVVKTINGERFPDALHALVDAAGGDARIEIRDGFLDRVGMWALQACCDCYLSLHRSEGLGLGMAECMLLGKPVVATAYSGNLAFMDADNSCLVDYALVPVREGEYPAWQGQHWAEPDIDQAAAYLRRLAEEPAYARRIGDRAEASVRERLSASASSAAIAARLAAIRARSSH